MFWGVNGGQRGGRKWLRRGSINIPYFGTTQLGYSARVPAAQNAELGSARVCSHEWTRGLIHPRVIHGSASHHVVFNFVPRGTWCSFSPRSTWRIYRSTACVIHEMQRKTDMLRSSLIGTICVSALLSSYILCSLFLIISGPFSLTCSNPRGCVNGVLPVDRLDCQCESSVSCWCLCVFLSSILLFIDYIYSIDSLSCRQAISCELLVKLSFHFIKLTLTH